MNLLISGLVAVSAFLILPTVIASGMKRWISRPEPKVDSDSIRCYGLDGRSSEVCCDNPGFAGCSCSCPCHERDEILDDDKVAPRGFGRGHHLHLHLHQGSTELHPVPIQKH